jgi:tetratricopeptide (TPR) repeat protein
MNKNRIQMLESYIQEDPSDPFNYYALAIEFIEEHPEKSKQLFDKLLSENQDYLPVYYTAGIFYSERNEINKALDILSKGIELAKKTSDFKTVRELQNAIQNLDD